MRNSLTSKERRGLAAVVAAALLCISSGFIFRNCSSMTSINPSASSYESVASPESAADTVLTDNPVRKGKSGRKRKKKVEKRKTLKTYPVRDPLSEPCD
ncbi:MAG: hypothetical protein K2H49_07305 [Muribaculaceae bacterium]|nr:hypothetical protein [Muribaculaceae bacterium]